MAHAWIPRGTVINVQKYNRATDLTTHLMTYEIQVSFNTLDEQVFCRLFPTNSEGLALEWYYVLAPCLVDSFNTLAMLFLAHFIDRKIVSATKITLNYVEQGENHYNS